MLQEIILPPLGIENSYSLGLISDTKTYWQLSLTHNFFFLAALGLRCCTWAFSSCSEQGLFFVAGHGLLIAVVPLVAEHRF